MSLNELAKECLKRSTEKGFCDQPIEVGTLLMLIVSELSEALEADRESKYTDPLDMAWAESCTDESHIIQEHFPQKIKDTFEDEIADAFIRLLFLVGKMGIDIDKHIELKMKYNQTRPKKHGKKY